jgi:hypothetical protein
VTSFLRSAFARLPPVVRRDERIDDLERQLEREAGREERSYGVPSFRRYIYAERRIADHLRRLDDTDRGHLVTHKLKSYTFARSYGIEVPEVFGVWDLPLDIAWDDLPDTVVIKSAHGTAARGVTPLRRTEDGWTMVTTTDSIDPAKIVRELARRETEGGVGGPYFAEELLGGGVGNSLPVDVKVHAFYGEISHVLLRRVSVHRDSKATAFRVILPDGTDPGPIVRGLPHDHEIPVPSNLDELMEVARRMSLGIPRAFVRVDLYDIDGRVVFGELTPRPGHLMDYGPKEDERLGHLWERAHARVMNDALGGAGFAMRFGTGPRELMVGGQPYVPDGVPPR